MEERFSHLSQQLDRRLEDLRNSLENQIRETRHAGNNQGQQISALAVRIETAEREIRTLRQVAHKTREEMQNFVGVEDALERAKGELQAEQRAQATRLGTLERSDQTESRRVADMLSVAKAVSWLVGLALAVWAVADKLRG